MSNEKMKRAAVRANGILSKSVLLFLFLIPIIYILQATGVSHNSMEELVAVTVLILVLSVVPGIFNKLSYNEELIANITLLSMEILLMMLSMNPHAELSIIYVVVPVVSLIYCNQKITQRISLLSYMGMMGVCAYRAFVIEESGTGLYSDEVIYLTLLKFTVEFGAVAVIVSYGAGFFEGMILEKGDTAVRESGLAVSDQDQTGKRENSLQESVYDVQGMFCGIEKDMQAMIKGKNKFFEMEIDPHLPVKLAGAKEEIRKALAGICSDLLMYHSEAAVKMYVTYDSGIVPKKNQNITLIIKISGYTDITAVTANKAALGYYLSQKVIEQLKGSFEDLSNSEEAVFRICLLQRVEDERTIAYRKEQQLQELRQIQNEAAGQGRHTLFHHQIKALVVDDNKESCKLIDAILSSMGVEVVCTDNGASAIELLETQEYQLVFMDQMMPEKSGLETVKELRYQEDEYYQKLPIILMTINTKEEAKKEYGEAGFTDCISKPINVNEVKSSLQKWIKDDYPLTYAEYKKMQEMENEQ